jgi:hypothetical protein
MPCPEQKSINSGFQAVRKLKTVHDKAYARFKAYDNFPEIAKRKECSIKNREIEPGVHKTKYLQATHFPRKA